LESSTLEEDEKLEVDKDDGAGEDGETNDEDFIDEKSTSNFGLELFKYDCCILVFYFC
jgi:hypothetical protein